MKSILRRRPSPALVIACVALFVSLGGVSYGVATGFIDSREIKNNAIRSKDVRNNTLRTFDVRNNEIRGFDIRNSSVQGRDVALNTLTGADISEQDLAKVPSAATADAATDAQTVGGMSVRKIAVKQPQATATTEIFRGDGFVLEAGCTLAEVDLQLDGVTGGPETHAGWNVELENPTDVNTASDPDLQPAEDHDLLGTSDRGFGTITVATADGKVSTIQFAARDTPAFTGETVCSVSATVVSG